ncbi:hypothetical protein DXM21_08105 [Agrobacterium rosae]|nr:hypothetical protein DXM21_08105 [Agrobacterium rosae]KAA3521541.1 hypothetical protein DXM25_09880 [Agrobacterium rosae]
MALERKNDAVWCCSADPTLVILGLDPRIYVGCLGLDGENAAPPVDPRVKPEDDGGGGGRMTTERAEDTR